MCVHYILHLPSLYTAFRNSSGIIRHKSLSYTYRISLFVYSLGGKNEPSDALKKQVRCKKNVENINVIITKKMAHQQRIKNKINSYSFNTIRCMSNKNTIHFKIRRCLRNFCTRLTIPKWQLIHSIQLIQITKFFHSIVSCIYCGHFR